MCYSHSVSVLWSQRNPSLLCHCVHNIYAKVKVTLHEKFSLFSVYFSGRYVVDMFNSVQIGLLRRGLLLLHNSARSHAAHATQDSLGTLMGPSWFLALHQGSHPKYSCPSQSTARVPLVANVFPVMRRLNVRYGRGYSSSWQQFDAPDLQKLVKQWDMCNNVLQYCMEQCIVCSGNFLVCFIASVWSFLLAAPHISKVLWSSGSKSTMLVSNYKGQKCTEELLKMFCE